jgi:hypothetical protein
MRIPRNEKTMWIIAISWFLLNSIAFITGGIIATLITTYLIIAVLGVWILHPKLQNK